MKIPDLSQKTDAEIRTWIENHERKGATQDPLYQALVEEEARRKGRGLNPDTSLKHLMQSAKARRFTTYGTLADANGVPWNQARHLMNGPGGHLDQLLSICHARRLPLLSAICVNQQGVGTGELAEDSLSGFVNGAKRLGIEVTDERAFLRKCQEECFAWGQRQS
jgi:hypothetical protein